MIKRKFRNILCSFNDNYLKAPFDNMFIIFNVTQHLHNKTNFFGRKKKPKPLFLIEGRF